MGSQAEPVDQLIGLGLGGAPVDLPEAGDEFEIFERCQPIIDHGFVRNPGDDALG
ncbi:hypothetical protein D3C86_2047800 [compost metagenome]